ncbi:hypothetical protein O6H91_01G088500 [Diphasiastrum complanatum]|uniref:Uncharacterized protein n=3 Tax=Diphasiastrum complanatum TaxID=34168 RepID=A0ACC2ET64_DIPCM|nr:hypothetical protein O6H91_01G088500 [Diphasiastrum complanatum]KAJ7569678.1 hypothetical protein O6H91_01G088500 [Diphasiastrum complanatum]KAJ7569679.1 hypothetical protein O6H91_01G088500 [Diphasiastrum complanatum]
MGYWMDVISCNSWNLSSTRLNFPAPLAIDGVCLQKTQADRSGIPFENRRFTTFTCRAKTDVSQAEFANSVKSWVYNRLMHVDKLINPVPTLRAQRLISASLGRNASVSATNPIVEAVTVEDIRVKVPAIPKLSHKWRDIQGANDWKNLLDPLDSDLKAEIIKYGEFAQLCYDAFDYDSHSKFCGSCRFNPKKLLKMYGLRYEDYEITKYLYATSDISLPTFFLRSDFDDRWSTSANWIGFVAVSSSEREIERLGRRDIVVAWRGTVTKLDWLADLQNSLCPYGLDRRSVGRSVNGDVRVETGFLSLYTTKKATDLYNQQSAREQLQSEIQRLRQLYMGEELSISLTGHSLGAALALISGYDLAESGLNMRLGNAPRPTFSPSPSMSLGNIFKHDEQAVQNVDEVDKIPITVFSFAGPRVGNSAFRDRVNNLGVKVLRIVNVNDLVPKVPGVLLNEKFQFLHDWIERLPWTYSHTGVEFAVDNLKSPYLQPSLDPSDLHNLEAYLHLLDGQYTAFGEKFSISFSRDPALINKNSDFLKKDLKIPGFWRQDKDKGLVKHPDGRLKFRGREPEDIPPYH